MKKYGYTEKRILLMDDVRMLAIKKHWFEYDGDQFYWNQFYDKLKACNSSQYGITSDDIIELAGTICEGSNISAMNDIEFCEICNNLAYYCISSFSIDE